MENGKWRMKKSNQTPAGFQQLGQTPTFGSLRKRPDAF
jgi:hypothetical protein